MRNSGYLINLIFFSFLYFALFTTSIKAQLIPLETDTLIYSESISKLIIIDRQNLKEKGYYGSEYEIIRESDAWQLYRLKQYYELDTKELFLDVDLENDLNKRRMGKVSNQAMNLLFAAINNRENDDLYLNKIPFSEPKLRADYFENISTDFFSASEIDIINFFFRNDTFRQEALEKLYASYWNFDYPLCSLLIVRGNDTLQLFTDQQEPYMLPWTIDGRFESYNPQISIAISGIIPYKKYANIDRLSGDGFEYQLGKILYEVFCKPEIAFQRMKLLFSKEIEMIEAYFTVLEIDFKDKSAIDIQGNNMRILLKDDVLPVNFQFETRFSIKGDSIFQPYIFLATRNTYKARLQKTDWWYNQVIGASATKAFIHFTDSTSMTPRAIQFFKNDTKRFVDKNKLAEDLKNSLLVTVRESGQKYSRWIILPDSRLILWHYKGNGVLGFSDLDLGMQPSDKFPLKVVGKYINEMGLIH